MRRWLDVAILITILSACASTAPPRQAEPSTVRWLKGQTHAHTSNSADSQTPPEVVAAWYQRAGFDFLVLTDHNHVTDLRWDGPLLVIPGVEITQNPRTCSPAPEGSYCPMHVNGLFVDPARSFAAAAPPEEPPPDRRARYTYAIDLAEELGGIAQINHPNYQWMAGGDDLVALGRGGTRLVEIANGSGTNDDGDAVHPSTEASWDVALTEGVHVWGVATDDAHHYDDADAVEAKGEAAYRGGRGWIMVRAAPDPASIRAAIVRGDFYASTGVTLADVAVSEDALTIVANEDLDIRFVGAGGVTLLATRGRSSTYTLGAGDLYVRAVVSDAAGHHAWSQPLFRLR